MAFYLCPLFFFGGFWGRRKTRHEALSGEEVVPWVGGQRRGSGQNVLTKVVRNCGWRCGFGGGRSRASSGENSMTGICCNHNV